MFGALNVGNERRAPPEAIKIFLAVNRFVQTKQPDRMLGPQARRGSRTPRRSIL